MPTATVETEKRSADSLQGLVREIGSARDTANFARFARQSEAGLDGHDYALDARMPHIPERWASPDLREAWITGYLTELRNRLQAQNADFREPA